MTDLVDRLRGWTVSVHAIPASDLMDEAADEIDRLRKISSQNSPAVALLLDRIDSSQRTLAFEQEAEIARLRARPCPYVTGDVTQYCTLTPFTLTDEEREAVHQAAIRVGALCQRGSQHMAATLRGLLERSGGCTPQSDCGADRKSVASQRCRDTGGQPFESAPTTLPDDAVPASDGGGFPNDSCCEPTLTDAEREAVEAALHGLETHAGPKDYGATKKILLGLLERLA